MSRKTLILSASAALAVLAASPALASGGSGGGGGGQSCAPLTTLVKLAHSDGTGNSAITVQATIRNCTTGAQPMALNVSVPTSSTVPFNFSTGSASLQPGKSLTMNASPIGSTPMQLHYGQTYNVVATLTQTGADPKTIATITTPVTMPVGVVA
jgi:hypothetical protein